MPSTNVSLVLNDRKGTVGWPLTKKGQTVYSYDPGHPAGTDMGEVIASDDSEGLQVLYGPPFDVLVERLKLFKGPIDAVVVPFPISQEILGMLDMLSKSGVLGDATVLDFHQNK